MAMDKSWPDCEILLPHVLVATSHHGYLQDRGGGDSDDQSETNIVFDKEQALRLVELIHNSTW